MNVGTDFSSLGMIPSLTSQVPKTVGEQFESLLAQQLVHAMVQSQGQDQTEGDNPGGDYLGMMEGVLSEELAKTQQLGIAKALGPALEGKQ